MTLRRSKNSLPDSVRLELAAAAIEQAGAQMLLEMHGVLASHRRGRFNRSAAPTKLPDSTTCRNTFILSRVSIGGVVYSNSLRSDCLHYLAWWATECSDISAFAVWHIRSLDKSHLKI